jgi:uncharacterized membrane protein (DUF485 family)
MAGFGHGPAQPAEQEHQTTISRNARYGLWLFSLYLLLYGIYVALNTFAPEVMDAIPFAGVNLAILYGLGLIVAAIILALVYAWLCRAPARDGSRGEGRA